MREVIYKPTNTGDGVIVQYTDSFILDKGMKISVSNQYIAVVFDNEKISFRVEPCVGKVIFTLRRYPKCRGELVIFR